MPKGRPAGEVEKRIWDVEEFNVYFAHLSGQDVRMERLVPEYPYESPATDNITVETWKATRFRPNYPGFEVGVLNAEDKDVHGNTMLWTVRNSYLEED
jgi:hypothetical protein